MDGGTNGCVRGEINEQISGQFWMAKKLYIHVIL